MEARSNDPYEQQLLAVFETCLEKDQSKLTETGLRNLCDKLQLEERGDELISSLLAEKSLNPTISFTDFRNGLVNLLGSSQTDSQTITKDSISESPQKHGHWSIALETQRIRQFCGKFNGSTNGSMNSDSDCPMLSKQILECIFEKLDMDCDGLINFEDFMMMFQNGRNLQESLNLDWMDRSRENDANRPKSSLNMLGPDQTGLIRKNSVINLWNLAGVTDATNLLSELGFSGTDISLTELTTFLNDEIKSLQHEPINPAVQTHMNLLKGALIIYQEEVRSMNTIIDQLRGERDKLRIDVAEANERASLLAQEIDENHVKLEKTRQEHIKQLELKHAETIRELTHQNSTEREAQTAAIRSLTEQLQALQQEEQQIRAKLASALNENHSLELENQSHLEQISKLKHSNNQLLMKVQILAAEHDEAVQNDERENEQVISLVDRIKMLQAESALLRDQNDELTTELEALKSRGVELKTRESNFLKVQFSDGSEGPNSVTDSEPLADQVPELKNERQPESVDSQLSYTNWLQTDEDKKFASRIIRDLKSILDDTSSCTSDCGYRNTISELLSNLETIPADLLKTEDSIKVENKAETECEERTSESLRDLVVNKAEKAKLIKRISTSDDMIHNIDRNFNNLDIKSGKSKSLRDYPPRKDESSSEGKIDKDRTTPLNVTSDAVDGNDLESIKQDRDRLSLLLKEQELRHSNEKRLMQEQCAELERSLDSLRNEYYQCEDYWQGKLEEERQLIEQEQKISDEKLAELIAKIAEYEEQFSMGDKSRNDGRLSPIEEKFNLEQQYSDLEEEFDQFKSHSEELLSQKDKEIMELEEKVAKKEVERTDIAIQTIEHRCIRRTSSLPSGYASVLPTDLLSTGLSPPGSSVSKLNYYGLNQKLFEPSKLNQIAEHSIAQNEFLFVPPRLNVPCLCHQVDNYSSIEGEIHRLLQKKIDTDSECTSLLKQKENLVKEIIELQSIKGGQYCGDTYLKKLTSKLHTEEHKRKSLQSALKQQKIYTEKLMEKTWKQHKTEVESLQVIVKNTQESLQKQIQVNSQNIERLGKIDLIMKDIYLENAFLKKQIERLETHCHMLTNCSTESTSV